MYQKSIISKSTKDKSTFTAFYSNPRIRIIRISASGPEVPAKDCTAQVVSKS